MIDKCVFQNIGEKEAVITFFSTIHLTDKKWILTGKQGFVKANPNRKKTVNGMPLLATSILAQWRHYRKREKRITLLPVKSKQNN
jgi:hypothetical protein